MQPQLCMAREKLKFYETLQLFSSLNENVHMFKDAAADNQKIIDVTETFFLALYGDDLKCP